MTQNPKVEQFNAAVIAAIAAVKDELKAEIIAAVLRRHAMLQQEVAAYLAQQRAGSAYANQVGAAP